MYRVFTRESGAQKGTARPATGGRKGIYGSEGGKFSLLRGVWGSNKVDELQRGERLYPLRIKIDIERRVVAKSGGLAEPEVVEGSDWRLIYSRLDVRRGVGDVVSQECGDMGT